jgi:hypothetical protein
VVPSDKEAFLVAVASLPIANVMFFYWSPGKRQNTKEGIPRATQYILEPRSSDRVKGTSPKRGIKKEKQVGKEIEGKSGTTEADRNVFGALPDMWPNL